MNMMNGYSCRRNELVFYIGFGLFMLANMLDLALTTAILTGSSIFVYVIKIARYASYAICFFKIIFDSIYEKSRFWKLFFILVLTAISYMICLNKTMLLAASIILAAENISSKMVVKIAFILQTVTLFLMIFLSQTGMIEDYIWEPDIRPRHFLGFSWVTTSAVLYFFIILEYIYLKHGQLKFSESCILLVINGWLYYMTDSRMVFLLSGILIFYFTLFQKRILDGWIIKEIEKYVYLIPVVISGFAIAIHAFYNPDSVIYSKLNNLLSGRLRLGKTALSTYGINLFGHKIEWVGFSVVEHLEGEYNYVDCSYLQILLEYGLIFLLIVLLAYAVILAVTVKKREYYLTWVIVFILIFSITEPRLVNFMYNVFPILCITEISNIKLKRREGIV